MHLMCCSVSYRYISEAALSVLVFCCLGVFINNLLVANVSSILVQGSYKGLLFGELESMEVGHRPQ